MKKDEVMVSRSLKKLNGEELEKIEGGNGNFEPHSHIDQVLMGELPFDGSKNIETMRILVP